MLVRGPRALCACGGPLPRGRAFRIPWAGLRLVRGTVPRPWRGRGTARSRSSRRCSALPSRKLRGRSAGCPSGNTREALGRRETLAGR
uniref:Uncharacterized protein n=1 Tax=Ixodes ricinus TaxID=34613 RepID=A0A6B0UBS6_IXORI